MRNKKQTALQEEGKEEKIKKKKTEKFKMSDKRPVAGEQILLRPSYFP